MQSGGAGFAGVWSGDERRLDGAHQGAEAPALPASGAGMSVGAESLDHAGTRLQDPRLVAIVGIAFGVIAFWLVLPPETVRAVGVPIALAVAGVACGAWTVTR